MTYHDALAIKWANHNGQRGTTKQVTAIQRQLTVIDLERMLAERGYTIEALAAQHLKG